MEKNEVKRLIEVASGREKADILVKNANVVDVFNKECFLTNVLIADGKIVAFTDKEEEAEKVIDASYRYMIPGFIDSHCHIESSHLSPSGFSNLILPYGTTTVIADPHEICNVCGLDGLDYLLDSIKKIPLKVFLMLPSCVPSTPFEHSGAKLDAKDYLKYIDNENILGLGELMNAPGLINSDEEILEKIILSKNHNKLIDGHAPLLGGRDLDAYSSTGIFADHECSNINEMHDKLRRGFYIMLREGTSCQNVRTLIKGVNKNNYSRCLFCTDDRQPETINKYGHINHAVNIAIEEKIDPLVAISMATLNPAVCFNLKDRGAIAPGYRADFFFSKTLDYINAEETYVSGNIVSKNHKIIEKAKRINSSKVASSVRIKEGVEEKLKLKLNSTKARVIEIIPGEIITKERIEEVKIDKDNFWGFDENKDILKITVVERHHKLGYVANALIYGYGLKHGAIATTISHDSHNIIVVSDNDDDLLLALKTIEEVGGGITMVQDGNVLFTHKLEIAGLMTDEDDQEVSEVLKMMKDKAYEMGVNKNIDPFMTLSFMALPVIPALKITDVGLFDVNKFQFVDTSI